ncbi:MAG TPA: hypothetical protein VJN94_00495 [Candidatus Binataceae bacterium]|nr:hypothetical protein [Candidatus Binataceae bacterium]
MKRVTLALVVVMLLWPAISRAQYMDQDEQNPTQYRDVDDGQLLKVVSYALTPVGMALEWGLTRPLHYLATQTAVAPLLSGDNGSSLFNQNDNASQVPPGTFGPYTINPTNSEVANSQVVTPVPVRRIPLPPAETIPPSPPTQAGQPAFER